MGKESKNKSEKNQELVEKNKKEIKEKLQQWQKKIEEEKVTVFILDEFHLRGDDILGYVWEKTNIRVEIPIKNQKDRQTYYGALYYQTKEFLVKEYESSNSENTKKFLDYLQDQRKGKKIAIIWDGATYHDSQKIREDLEELNRGKEEENWQITCIKFAPNAPEKNPVEDI